MTKAKMAGGLRAVLARRCGPRSRAVRPVIFVVPLFLAAIAPATVNAHDIYHGLTSNFGKDCCDNSDCRPAHYRITPAGVQMLLIRSGSACLVQRSSIDCCQETPVRPPEVIGVVAAPTILTR